ncbi:TPR and ankyrin repeat-containing protein 1 [Quaeritorhiza haematococci]|nr:TPR and ankyrin repeat-containing protein 1 [Quaeritorhiza haematococci]
MPSSDDPSDSDEIPALESSGDESATDTSDADESSFYRLNPPRNQKATGRGNLRQPAAPPKPNPAPKSSPAPKPASQNAKKTPAPVPASASRTFPKPTPANIKPVVTPLYAPNNKAFCIFKGPLYEGNNNIYGRVKAVIEEAPDANVNPFKEKGSGTAEWCLYAAVALNDVNFLKSPVVMPHLKKLTSSTTEASQKKVQLLMIIAVVTRNRAALKFLLDEVRKVFRSAAFPVDTFGQKPATLSYHPVHWLLLNGYNDLFFDYLSGCTGDEGNWVLNPYEFNDWTAVPPPTAVDGMGKLISWYNNETPLKEKARPLFHHLIDISTELERQATNALPSQKDHYNKVLDTYRKGLVAFFKYVSLLAEKHKKKTGGKKASRPVNQIYFSVLDENRRNPSEVACLAANVVAVEECLKYGAFILNNSSSNQPPGETPIFDAEMLASVGLDDKKLMDKPYHAGMKSLLTSKPTFISLIARESWNNYRKDAFKISRRAAFVKHFLNQEPLLDGPVGYRDIKEILRAAWMQDGAHQQEWDAVISEISRKLKFPNEFATLILLVLACACGDGESGRYLMPRVKDVVRPHLNAKGNQNSKEDVLLLLRHVVLHPFVLRRRLDSGIWVDDAAGRVEENIKFLRHLLSLEGIEINKQLPRRIPPEWIRDASMDDRTWQALQRVGYVSVRRSPLALAVEHDNEQAVSLLLKYDANLDLLLDDKNETIFNIAVRASWREGAPTRVLVVLIEAVSARLRGDKYQFDLKITDLLNMVGNKSLALRETLETANKSWKKIRSNVKKKQQKQKKRERDLNKEPQDVEGPEKVDRDSRPEEGDDDDNEDAATGKSINKLFNSLSVEDKRSRCLQHVAGLLSDFESGKELPLLNIQKLSARGRSTEANPPEETEEANPTSRFGVQLQQHVRLEQRDWSIGFDLTDASGRKQFLINKVAPIVGRLEICQWELEITKQAQQDWMNLSPFEAIEGLTHLVALAEGDLGEYLMTKLNVDTFPILLNTITDDPAEKEFVEQVQKEMRLFESHLNGGSRIIFQLVAVYSQRLNGKAQTVGAEVDQYTDAIRVWGFPKSERDAMQMVDVIVGAFKDSRSSLQGQRVLVALPRKKRDLNEQQTWTWESIKGEMARRPRALVRADDYKRIPEIRNAPPVAVARHLCTSDRTVIKYYQLTSGLAWHVVRHSLYSWYRTLSPNSEGVSTLTHDELLEMKVSSQFEAPFVLSEVEHKVSSLEPPASILLLGRSGTGKTSCALTRMYTEYMKYWAKQTLNQQPVHAGPLPECAKNHSHFHQIFITANPVLRKEVQRMFDAFVFSTLTPITTIMDHNAHFPEMMAVEREVMVPKRFRPGDVPEGAWPLFLTTREWFLALDATLPSHQNFFPRVEETGELACIVESGAIAAEDADLSEIPEDLDDDFFDNPLTFVEDVASKKKTKRGEKAGQHKNIGGGINLRNVEIENENQVEDLAGDGQAPDGDAPVAVLPRFIEVDYRYFLRKIWPLIRGRHTFDSNIVWTEIFSFIKGSLDALESSTGYLSREEYRQLGRKRSVITDQEDRNAIYDMFEAYEKYKKSERYKIGNLFDVMDLVFHLHKHFRSGSLRHEQGADTTKIADDQNYYAGIPIHRIIHDEVQDFTQAELALDFLITSDPNRLFFTGDTCQTIARGVGFRFVDLKSIFYREKEFINRIRETRKITDRAGIGENGDATPETTITIIQPSLLAEPPVQTIEVPDVLHLTQNYRSHSGILNIANSVVDLLAHYFPDSFDKMAPEQGISVGVKPIIFRGTKNDDREVGITRPSPAHDLNVLLYGDPEGGGDQPEFGAKQAIIVRNSDAREALASRFGNAIILTILEAKGLEFDDVLLYNFFKDSEATAETWRLITSYELNIQKQDTQTKVKVHRRHKDFNAKTDSVLMSELKLLYTAVTRARQQLFVFDEDPEKHGPMFEFLARRDLAFVVEKTMLSEEGIRTMISAQGEGMTLKAFPKQSSSQEWWDTGHKMLRARRFDTAAICFHRAKDSVLEDYSSAMMRKQEAERLRERIASVGGRTGGQGDKDKADANKLMFDAACIFLLIGCLKHAAYAFSHADEKELAADLYKCIGEKERAASMYKAIKRNEDAARLYEEVRQFEKAIQCFIEADKLIEAKRVRKLSGKKDIGDDVFKQAAEKSFREAQTLVEQHAYQVKVGKVFNRDLYQKKRDDGIARAREIQDVKLREEIFRRFECWEEVVQIISGGTLEQQMEACDILAFHCSKYADAMEAALKLDNPWLALQIRQKQLNRLILDGYDYPEGDDERAEDLAKEAWKKVDDELEHNTGIIVDRRQPSAVRQKTQERVFTAYLCMLAEACYKQSVSKIQKAKRVFAMLGIRFWIGLVLCVEKWLELRKRAVKRVRKAPSDSGENDFQATSNSSTEEPWYLFTSEYFVFGDDGTDVDEELMAALDLPDDLPGSSGMLSLWFKLAEIVDKKCKGTELTLGADKQEAKGFRYVLGVEVGTVGDSAEYLVRHTSPLYALYEQAERGLSNLPEHQRPKLLRRPLKSKGDGTWQVSQNPKWEGIWQVSSADVHNFMKAICLAKIQRWFARCHVQIRRFAMGEAHQYEHLQEWLRHVRPDGMVQQGVVDSSDGIENKVMDFDAMDPKNAKNSSVVKSRSFPVQGLQQIDAELSPSKQERTNESQPRCLNTNGSTYFHEKMDWSYLADKIVFFESALVLCAHALSEMYAKLLGDLPDHYEQPGTSFAALRLTATTMLYELGPVVSSLFWMRLYKSTGVCTHIHDFVRGRFLYLFSGGKLANELSAIGKFEKQHRRTMPWLQWIVASGVEASTIEQELKVNEVLLGALSKPENRQIMRLFEEPMRNIMPFDVGSKLRRCIRTAELLAHQIRCHEGTRPETRRRLGLKGFSPFKVPLDFRALFWWDFTAEQLEPVVSVWFDVIGFEGKWEIEEAKAAAAAEVDMAAKQPARKSKIKKIKKGQKKASGTAKKVDSVETQETTTASASASMRRSNSAVADPSHFEEINVKPAVWTEMDNGSQDLPAVQEDNDSGSEGDVEMDAELPAPSRLRKSKKARVGSYFLRKRSAL